MAHNNTPASGTTVGSRATAEAESLGITRRELFAQRNENKKREQRGKEVLPISGVSETATDAQNQSTLAFSNGDKLTSNDLNNNRQETILPNTEPELGSNQLMDTIVDENQTLLDKRAEEVKNEKDDTVSGIQGLIKDIAGEESKLGGFEKDAGVSQFQEQADTFQQSINVESRALKNTIERLTNDPNLVGSVRGRIISEETRRSTSKAADLAILRDVSLGNIDRAQATAQAKVDALTAPLKAELDGKKFLLDVNKDIWTATEKAELNEDIKVLDRAYDKKLRADTSLEDEKLRFVTNAVEAGASPSKLAEIQGAESMEDLLAVSGIQGYSTSRAQRLANSLKSLQISKTQKEISAMTKEEKEKMEQDERNANRRVELETETAELKALKDHEGMDSRVGPVPVARRNIAVKDKFGAGQDFAGKIHQFSSTAALQELKDLKATGATMGALNRSELQLLLDASTKINGWEIRDKEGVGIGEWNISEKKFQEELDTIIELREKSFIGLGGFLPGSEVELEMSNVYLDEVDDALEDSAYETAGYNL